MLSYWKIIGTHPDLIGAQEEDVLGYVLASSADEARDKFVANLTEELAAEFGEEEVDLDDPDLDIPRVQRAEYECSEEEWHRRLAGEIDNNRPLSVPEGPTTSLTMFKFRAFGADYPDFSLGIIEASSPEEALSILASENERECAAEERRTRRKRPLPRLDISKIEAIPHVLSAEERAQHERMVLEYEASAAREREYVARERAAGREPHSAGDDGDWYLGHD